MGMRRAYATLRDWVEATGSQAQAAKVLGLSEPYLSLLLNRKRQPSLDQALRIAGIANIPVESLLLEPEVKGEGEARSEVA